MYLSNVFDIWIAEFYIIKMLRKANEKSVEAQKSNNSKYSAISDQMVISSEIREFWEG